MDVHFHLFIVYQMYQYTVSDIKRGTIFLRKLKTRDRYSLVVQLSSEKNHQICTQETFCDIKWNLYEAWPGVYWVGSSLLSLISKLELQLFDLITINIQPLCAVNPRWTHPTITRRLAPLFIRVTLRSKLRSANYLHVKISCKKWMRI